MDNLATSTSDQGFHHERGHQIIINPDLRSLQYPNHPVEKDDGRTASHDFSIEIDQFAFVANTDQDSLYTTLFEHQQILPLLFRILIRYGNQHTIPLLTQVTLGLLDEIHEKRGHHFGNDDAYIPCVLFAQVHGQLISLVTHPVGRLTDQLHGGRLHVVRVSSQGSRNGTFRDAQCFGDVNNGHIFHGSYN